jgi:hypothetical protein
MIGNVELIARIAAGAVLGGVIGYERDRHRRPVGLRTHLKDDHLMRRRVSVVLGEGEPGIGGVVSALTELGATVSEIEYERRLDDGKKRIVATFDVRFVDTVGVAKIIEAVESVQGVRRVRVEHHL